MVELIREYQDVVLSIIASLLFFALFYVAFELVSVLNAIDIEVMI